MASLTEVIRVGDASSRLRVRRALLTVAEAAEPKSLASSAERIALGSAEGNDLIVEGATVSRFHAELVRTPDGFRVRDLGSTNGTFVNGVRVVDAFLGDPATLQLGGSTIRFQIAEQHDDIELYPDSQFGRMVGESISMRAMFAQLVRLAASNATVLIQGESGTGKELVAEAIHQLGARAKKPFIIVDCGAIPNELVETELFGHERGAFTGATSERRGAFEAADGGTLFLDEIGELPLAVQPKLLRALERRQVKRVGSDLHRTVDVRFLAATHRDLRQLVNRGLFREDLYYRLAVAPIRVPPLRERLDDLPVLLKHLWRETGNALGLAPTAYVEPSGETLRSLASMPWEGNVRELRNFVERSLALVGELDIASLRAPSPEAAPPGVRLDLPYKEAKEAWLEQFEITYLSKRLADAGGNVSQMAREAHVDRAYVIKLLRKRSVR